MKVNTSLMDYTTQDIAVDSYGAIFTLTFRLTVNEIHNMEITNHYSPSNRLLLLWRKLSTGLECLFRMQLI